jgi:hypothetical protein
VTGVDDLVLHAFLSTEQACDRDLDAGMGESGEKFRGRPFRPAGAEPVEHGEDTQGRCHRSSG